MFPHAGYIRCPTVGTITAKAALIHPFELLERVLRSLEQPPAGIEIFGFHIPDGIHNFPPTHIKEMENFGGPILLVSDLEQD